VRALFLSHTAKPSGAELALFATVSAMAGVAPVVLFGEHGPMKDRFDAAGIPTLVFEMPPELVGFDRRDVRLGPALARPLRQAGSYLQGAERIVRAVRPDVLVSNSSKSHLMGFHLARRVRTPLVSIVRDRLTTEFYSSFGAWLLRTGLRTIPAGLIANSTSTAATVPGAWRLRQARAIVPSPVAPPPAALVEPRRSGRPPGPFRVGVAGRLSPWKGQHVAIEAFARAFSPGRAELHLLGGTLFGETDYETELRRLAVDRGVAPFVHFHGHVDGVYPQMATWDVCVHSSVIPEPFGQVVVQAMHLGLPTLAAAAGGPLETIVDDVDGVLYPPGDVNALAELLRRLAEDEGRRVRLGQAARMSARRYLPEVLAPAVREVLTQVVARGDHGGTA
jgi:glycosyltransferase involved in cell wall biosynthesis